MTDKTAEVFESENSNYSSTEVERALKLAEEALEDIIRVYKFETGTPVTTLAAIREARAEQEKQEPVAKVTDVFPTRVEWLREVAVNSLLYAAPVERHWYRLQGEE